MTPDEASAQLRSHNPEKKETQTVLDGGQPVRMANLTPPDELYCLLDVNPTPIVQYVANTRGRVDKSHVVLSTKRHRLETESRRKKDSIWWVAALASNTR